VIGTYAATLAVCGASLAIGQAALALCGARRWSWLAPGVGLALLCALCWGTVRLPGDGMVSALAVLASSVAAALYLRGRLEGGGGALRVGLPVALAALAAASLPFAVEGHFGILGTGFDPDMSQHLLSADRLAHGAGSQLLHQGYPLGPHAIVVALNKGLGIGLVQGFDGLSIAVAILASLTALAAFAEAPPIRRAGAALVVGLAYMVASYFAQGAFKEAMQALFVLAFALALRESTRPAWRKQPLRFVPAALIAVGSVYVYSYPGLIWLAGAGAIWAIAETARRTFAASAGGADEGGVEDDPARSAPPSSVTGPAAVRPVLLAFLLFVVLVAPEIGRMLDFRHFETFNPNGPGLGNLFGQISPFEALGIWPSGDFRLSPGDGAVPALGYYLGAAFAAILLVYGLVLCWRRRESALVSALLAAAGVYAVARLGGTPYTAAKAVVIAAPLAAAVILVPLLRRPVSVLYLLAAGGCSLLAFANAPVGPTSYSSALTGLRPLVASGSTLVLASPQLLGEEQGERYIAWELRGGRVCIGSAHGAERRGPSRRRPPQGVRFVVTEDWGSSGGSAPGPPFTGLRVRRRADPYVLWETTRPASGPSPCPLIAVRQARQAPAR
jgi:hypothetical protein